MFELNFVGLSATVRKLCSDILLLKISMWVCDDKR